MHARWFSILLVAASATGCLDGCLGTGTRSIALTGDPLLEPEARCSDDTECPAGGWRCDHRTARCFLPCSLDEDCPDERLCCVEEVETIAQLVCVPASACTLPNCPEQAPLAIDRACHMLCREDADCAVDGELCCDALPEPLCLTSESCARTHPCEAGMGRGADGVCRPTCGSIETCYPLGAYCADDRLCHGALAGQKGNTCGAASAASAMEPDAPLIYAGTTAPAACRLDEARCGPGSSSCHATLVVWDPDGDLPTEQASLAGAVELFLSDGAPLEPRSLELVRGDVDLLHVELCFESPSLFPSTAVRLRDLGGHASNAHCLPAEP